MAAHIADAKDALQQVKNTLSQGRWVFENDPSTTADDETVNLNKFFQGVDIRSAVDNAGNVTDPTFGGVLSNFDFTP